MDEKLVKIAIDYGLELSDLKDLLRRISGISPQFRSLAEFSVISEQNTKEYNSTEATELDVLFEPEATGSALTFEGNRYEDLGVLGVGGMGEVRRVKDHNLRRTMAMKVAKESVMKSASALNRFIAEARTTSQLQHPGILPVHEIGNLSDGRIFFTMQEVRGDTLSKVIRHFHGKKEDRDEYGLRRMIEMLRKTGEAVGYAHSMGFVHRDLKPANIMVGEHGSVLVVDWGLAKVLGKATEDDVIEVHSEEGIYTTRMGSIAGTPTYMPPEQARGEIDRIDPRSDVYALGAILYHMLSGRPPFLGADGAAVIKQVVAGPPRSLKEISPPKHLGSFPVELMRVCEIAMRRDLEGRYADANEFVREITDWLDGVKLRSQALVIVSEAENLVPEANSLLGQAASFRDEALAELKNIPSWSDDERKGSAWAKIDRASRLERQANFKLVQSEQLLHAALTYVPNLPEAHAALAARYRENHRKSESAMEQDSMNRAAAMLRSHASALPEHHPRRSSHFAYIRGDGALSIRTDPPGAEVILHRYQENNRRLRAEFLCVLGKTPIVKYSLPMGSYLLILRSKGHDEVRYPVFIGRQEHWDGVPPMGSESIPVPLPPKGLLGDFECYVPPGWFLCGGDSEASNSLPMRRIWLDSFVMHRFPVCNREYLLFLNHLMAEDREIEAIKNAPSERSGASSDPSSSIYGRDTRGRFHLQADVDGDIWEADWPVLKMNWRNANAYADYLSVKSRHRWRFPNEFEWEKAARGVDGRKFPWGDFSDPSWTCMRDSHSKRMLPVSIYRTPVDVGPFGIYGMAGNARDWTSTLYSPEGPLVVNSRISAGGQSSKTPSKEEFYTIKGGSWFDQERFLRLSSRTSEFFDRGNAYLGFRLIRNIEF